MTKKNVFLLVLIGIVIFIFLLYIIVTYTCYDKWSWCRGYWWRQLNNTIAPIFAHSVFPFLFSLVTYRLPDAVFTRWWHFTRWFIPLSMFLVLIAPGKGGDAIPTPEFGPIIFIFMMTIYVIISTVKIVWAYREGKHTPIIDQKS